jgi:hypothetical protein
MDFELYPTITLRSRSFNILQAPPQERLIQALNRNLNLQRYKVLYICRNYSGILSNLDRKLTNMEIRRPFTVFQLLTVLEEVRQSIIIVEHDLMMLYEDAVEMVEYVSNALSDATKESTVLLYSPGTDPFLEELARNAYRVWYFDEGPKASPRLVTKAFPKAERARPLCRHSHDQMVVETIGQYL